MKATMAMALQNPTSIPLITHLAVSDEECQSSVLKFTSLTALQYHRYGGDISMEALTCLSALPCLRHLCLRGVHLSVKSIKGLASLSRLEELILDGNKLEGSLDSLLTLPLLSLTLSVSDVLNGDTWLRLPSTLTSLVVLPPYPSSDRRTIPVMALSSLLNIARVHLWTKTYMPCYLNSPKVRDLLLHVPVWKQKDTLNLAACSSLQCLSLTTDKRKAEMLTPLTTQYQTLTSLKVLTRSMHESELGEVLNITTSLTRLNLQRQCISTLGESVNSTTLTTLKLRHNLLTDQGISSLQSNSALTQIDLRFNRLTDESLPLFIHHPNLTVLSLIENRISTYLRLTSNTNLIATKDGEGTYLHELCEKNQRMQRAAYQQWTVMIACIHKLYVKSLTA